MCCTEIFCYLITSWYKEAEAATLNKMAAPSHKMVAETFQPGLRPWKTGQHRRRFQSGSQRYLKPSQAPSSQACTHSGLLQKHTATHTEHWGAPGTSAAGQALCSHPGVLLPGARSTQGHSCHRNLPATAGRGPKPHGPLAQLSNNPALKVCAARRLQSNTEHGTLVHLKRFVFAPQQLMCSVSRASASGEATSLSSRCSSSRHNTRVPLLQHTKASDCCPRTCVMLSNLHCCHEGPCQAWSALLSIEKTLSHHRFPARGSHPGQQHTKSKRKRNPNPQHISDATTHTSVSPFLQPTARLSSSRAGQGGTPSSPSLHRSLNRFTLCTHSTLLTQPYLLLCTLVFAHRYAHVPAPTQTARPIRVFTHTWFLNPAISALAAPAGLTD